MTAPPDVDAPGLLQKRELFTLVDHDQVPPSSLDERQQLRVFARVRGRFCLSEQYGVRDQRPEPVGLHQGNQAIGHVRVRLDRHESRNAVRLKVLLDRSPECGDSFGWMSVRFGDDGGNREQATVSRQRAPDHHEMPARRWRSGQHQHIGIPRARIRAAPRQRFQNNSRAEDERSIAYVTPSRAQLAPLDGVVDESGDEQRHERRAGIDHQHRRDAGDEAENRDPPRHREAWPPGRSSDQGLHSSREIQHGIGRQEEHRENRSDGVEVAEQNAEQGDYERDHRRQPWVVGLSVSSRQHLWEHGILGQRLQGSRSAKQGAHRRSTTWLPECQARSTGASAPPA